MAVEKEPPESQFAFVAVAARRARQLMGGAPPLLDNPKSRQYTRVAMEELKKGLLEYEPPPPPEEQKDDKRR